MKSNAENQKEFYRKTEREIERQRVDYLRRSPSWSFKAPSSTPQSRAAQFVRDVRTTRMTRARLEEIEACAKQQQMLKACGICRLQTLSAF